MRPGWVPSLPRGGGVHPTSAASLIGACRFPTASPNTPLKPPTGGAADNGAYEDSLAFTRPVFPSPVVPGWNENASALPWASHPAVTHNARQGGDGPLDTGPDHILVNRSPIDVTTHHVRHHVARLPPAPPPCCDRAGGEGLSPPLESTAPHGARRGRVTAVIGTAATGSAPPGRRRAVVRTMGSRRGVTSSVGARPVGGLWGVRR